MSFEYLIGVDEVGRGPLAGPLCVGVCALSKKHSSIFYSSVCGIKDSKQLTHLEREAWATKLKALEQSGCIRLSTAFISERVIDRNGLANALSLATKRALLGVGTNSRRSFVMLDGTLRAPKEYLFQESIVKGDETDPIIAAASIVAKVRRDRYMTKRADEFPLYGFENHKGYGTNAHYRAIRKHGICPLHRKSFLSKLEI